MIVQELVSLGSLLDYLMTNAERINPNSELKIWASQIACGKCTLRALVLYRLNSFFHDFCQFFSDFSAVLS